MKWYETSGEGVQVVQEWRREQAGEMQLDVYVRARMRKKKSVALETVRACLPISAEGRRRFYAGCKASIG